MTRDTKKDIEEEYCHAREDKIHCEHWWDGEECCSCGATAMTDEQKLAQGMDVDEDLTPKA